jgi:hypothetical protein
MKRSLIRHIAGFLLISLITSSNIIARVHANSPGEIASSTNSDTAIEEPTSTVIQAPIPNGYTGVVILPGAKQAGILHPRLLISMGMERSK